MDFEWLMCVKFWDIFKFNGDFCMFDFYFKFVDLFDLFKMMNYD